MVDVAVLWKAFEKRLWQACGGVVRRKTGLFLPHSQLSRQSSLQVGGADITHILASSHLNTTCTKPKGEEKGILAAARHSTLVV